MNGSMGWRLGHTSNSDRGDDPVFYLEREDAKVLHTGPLVLVEEERAGFRVEGGDLGTGQVPARNGGVRQEVHDLATAREGRGDHERRAVTGFAGESIAGDPLKVERERKAQAAGIERGSGTGYLGRE